MRQDIVSIIVPIYKAEACIGACIESLINQTYAGIEIILIDDGSPDRSGEICDRYASIDHRIKVIHKSNGGRNAARLDGIIASTGNWIMFVDADDEIYENTVSSLIEHSQGYDLVKGKISLFDIDMKNSREYPPHILRECKGNGNDFITNILKGTILCNILGTIIKRECAYQEIFNLPKEIIFAEDLIINIRLGGAITRFNIIDVPIYKYRYYDGNTVTTFKNTLEYTDKVDRLITDALRERNKNGIFDNALLDYRLSVIKDLIYTDDGLLKSLTYKNIRKSSLRDKTLALNKKALYYIFKLNNLKAIRTVWNAYSKLWSLRK